MLLSTEIASFAGEMGEIKAIQMLADAGFDAIDLSLFRLGKDTEWFLNGEDYKEQARLLRKTVDEAGIVCNQAHAPFPSSVGDPDRDAQIYQNIIRAIQIAAIVGAGVIVVHPKQHLKYGMPGNPERLAQMNFEFYRSLIPYCEQFGIKVAAENMWQYDENRRCIVDSTCSGPEEFCRYLDEIGSPWIVGCLDIGHVPLVGGDLPYMIRSLGRMRLQALHVHDNNLQNDSHGLPYTMKINFDEVTEALREIGYEGDLTFEASYAYNKMPDAVKPEVARLMCAVGRRLIREIEGSRQ